MSNTVFSDFTAEVSPLLTDYLVGYRTAVAGGERRTTISSITTLLGTVMPSAIAGTANQITASASVGSITLSLAGPHNFTSLTSTALLLGAGTSAITASDLTYSTPTLSVPDAFNVSSAGSISLTAGGTNKSITVTATGTGVLSIPVGGATGFGASPFVGATVVSTGGIESGYFIDGYGSGSTNRFVGRGAGGTPALPTASPTGMTLANFTGRGYDGTSFSGTAGGMSVVTRGAWDTATPNRGTSVSITYIPFNNGTTLRTGIMINGSGSGLVRIGEASSTVDFAAWSNIGVQFNAGASMTYRDSSSPTGTVALAVMNSFNGATINATNANVVYTDLFNLYLVAPLTTGNASATRSHTLGIVDSTSAASATTGAVVIATTLGTAATSVGIGGGNINAGGTITSGGTLTVGTATIGAAASTVFTGGAGNMTIIGGTGASRTVTIQTTTSGSTATNALVLSATQNATFGGSITTSTPNGGTAAAWKLGTIAVVSPTSPNRTLEVDVAGTIYYIACKTTNN